MYGRPIEEGVGPQRCRKTLVPGGCAGRTKASTHGTALKGGGLGACVYCVGHGLKYRIWKK